MDKKTIKKVKENIGDYISYLKKEHNLSIDKVYLFGSYANKKARADSDIDICVISPMFLKIDPLTYLFTKRRKEDIINGIEPVGFHPNDFVDESPLAWEIKRTGLEIKV